jgi:hypothetical protein
MNTPDIFNSPDILGEQMNQDEILDRTTRIYRAADEIIEHITNDMDTDPEMTVAALGAAYAAAVDGCNVSMHDGVSLFLTFYKQLQAKGAAH